MKIEKHNSHGLELDITLTKEEAIDLVKTLQNCNEKLSAYALTYGCQFEDDNDKWEDAGLTIIVN